MIYAYGSFINNYRDGSADFIDKRDGHLLVGKEGIELSLVEKLEVLSKVVELGREVGSDGVGYP